MRLQAHAPPLDALLGTLAAEIEASLGVATTDDAPLWRPLPPQPGRGFRQPDGRVLSPQQMAVESWADELFFGGGLGGGKTWLEIGLAVTQHRNSVIFRREYSQLRGAEGIFEMSRQIIGLRGQPNESLFTWRNLPGDRSLEFGAARTLQDALRWAGRPHDLKCFDELPEFSEAVYRRLIAWLRTAHLGQRTRVVGAGNPPMTEEGQWVLRYWAAWYDKAHPRPAAPGELRWYVVGEDGKDLEVPGPASGPGRAPAVQVKQPDGTFKWIKPRSRTFIPSAVEDNPAYLATGYDEVLDAMPIEMRALRSGDFTAVRKDHENQVIATDWIIAAQARWRHDGGDGLPLDSVGVDPARGGGDEFVIAKRHGTWVGPLVVHPGAAAPNNTTGARLVFDAIDGDTGVPIQIDLGGGAGPAVHDQLRLLRLKAVGLDGSQKTRERTRPSGKVPDPSRRGTQAFRNKRALWHWRMREWLDPANGYDVALPPDPQLRADLAAPRWFLTLQGIQIEDKAEIKKRIGRSPDRGEAVLYACAQETVVPQGLLFMDAPVTSEVEAELALLEEALGIRHSPANGSGNGSAP